MCGAYPTQAELAEQKRQAELAAVKAEAAEFDNWLGQAIQTQTEQQPVVA